MLVLWVFSFFMQMFTKTHTHTIWTLWISKTPYKLSYMKKIVAWKDEVICPNSHDWIMIRLEICFPGCTSGKEPACQCRRHERHKLDPWVRKIPWSRKWQLIPVFLPGNPMDRGAGGLQSMGSQRVGHDWATEHGWIHSPSYWVSLFGDCASAEHCQPQLQQRQKERWG